MSETLYDVECLYCKEGMIELRSYCEEIASEEYINCYGESSKIRREWWIEYECKKCHRKIRVSEYAIKER